MHMWKKNTAGRENTKREDTATEAWSVSMFRSREGGVDCSKGLGFYSDKQK